MVAAPLKTGYTVDAVLVVAMSIFLAVVAEPAFPDNVPENVVAVIVPVDGFTLTVETVEVAAPETLVVAGVNNIGWLALVVAVTTLTFCPVVAVPVTFPVRLPENAPENVVAVTVPVDGTTNTVVTADVAEPATEVL